MSVADIAAEAREVAGETVPVDISTAGTLVDEGESEADRAEGDNGEVALADSDSVGMVMAFPPSISLMS